MDYSKFITYNVVGAVLWVLVTTWLGYWLGLKIENIDKYIIPVAGLIILISIAPYIKQFITDKELRNSIIAQLVSLKRRFIK